MSRPRSEEVSLGVGLVLLLVMLFVACNVAGMLVASATGGYWALVMLVVVSLVPMLSIGAAVRIERRPRHARRVLPRAIVVRRAR
jgi:hypothetical protein